MKDVVPKVVSQANIFLLRFWGESRSWLSCGRTFDLFAVPALDCKLGFTVACVLHEPFLLPYMRSYKSKALHSLSDEYIHIPDVQSTEHKMRVLSVPKVNQQIRLEDRAFMHQIMNVNRELRWGRTKLSYHGNTNWT